MDAGSDRHGRSSEKSPKSRTTDRSLRTRASEIIRSLFLGQTSLIHLK